MLKSSVVLVVALILVGCTAPEKVAYETVVASKAFLNKVQSQHPECATLPRVASTGTCTKLAQAVSAQHALVDVVEVLCAGPNFNAGNACDFPKKGTPAYTQAMDKLNAAIASYKMIEADLKGGLQ
jgi:hypothetical protein